MRYLYHAVEVVMRMMVVEWSWLKMGPKRSPDHAIADKDDGWTPNGIYT